MKRTIKKLATLAIAATTLAAPLAAQEVETQATSVEVKPGLMNFRYIHYVSDELYLNEQFHEVFNDAGEVFVHPLEEGGKATFTVDTISKGRYLLALDNPKSVLPEIKRYLFCFAHPDMEIEFETPPTEEVLANSYFRGHIDLTWLHGCILSVEAVRVDNVLRVIGAMGFPIMDIDLTKANNFTFSFKQPEGDHYPDGAVVLNSELGGEIYVGNSDARLKVVTNSSPNVFVPEPIRGDDPSSNEPSAASVEVEPGFAKFKHLGFNDGSYLNEQDGGIYVGSEGENIGFAIDTISKGRYLLAVDYADRLTSHRQYLFSFAHPDMLIEFERPLTEEDLANSYLGADVRLSGRILLVNAIRSSDGNTLTITASPDSDEPIAQIDLTKTNNFTFAFNQPNDAEDYPGGAVVINAEFGGDFVIDGRSYHVSVGGKLAASVRRPVFMLEEYTPSSNESPAAETVQVYTVNGTLTVQSPTAEIISIYSASGALHIQEHKDSGTAVYDITTLPQGVLIVKGSNGWAKKVVND